MVNSDEAGLQIQAVRCQVHALTTTMPYAVASTSVLEEGMAWGVLQAEVRACKKEKLEELKISVSDWRFGWWGVGECWEVTAERGVAGNQSGATGIDPKTLAW